MCFFFHQSNLRHSNLFQKETKDKDSVTETDYPEGFCKEPFCTYEGHSGDVLDLSWSKVFFYNFPFLQDFVRKCKVYVQCTMYNLK